MRLIFGIWFLGAAFVVWFGRLQNPYMEYVRNIPMPHPYPIRGVFFVILLMATHAAILALLLRPATYNCSWGRAFLALSISAGFFVYAGMAAMHAPPYFFAYLWWLLAVVVGAFVLLAWSGVGAIRHRAGS